MSAVPPPRANTRLLLGLVVWLVFWGFLGTISFLEVRALASLSDTMDYAGQSLDEAGTLVRVSRKWLDTLGYEEDEVIGRWIGDLMCESDRQGFRDRFQAFLKASLIYLLILRS